MRTALDELLPIAEVVEVPLAIEPMHPACATEWTFVTDLEQTVELVEQYDTPYLKMVCGSCRFIRLVGIRTIILTVLTVSEFVQLISPLLH